MIISVFIYFGVIALTLFLIKIVPIPNCSKGFSLGFLLKSTLSILIISYPLFVLLGSRVDIGTDYVNYERIYSYYQSSGITTFEPFFYGLFWFCDTNQWDFKVFIIITSFLSVVIPLGFVKLNFSKSEQFIASFTLLVLLFGSWFNIIRQCVAMGFLLISIRYLIERKRLLFLLTVLLASMFHVSSLVYIPCVFIAPIISKSNNRRKLIKNLILLVIGSIMLIFIYLHYGASLIYYDHIEGEAEDGITSKWFIIFSILLYIPEFSNMGKLLKIDKKYSMLYVLSVLEFCCYLFGLYMNLGYRIGQLFSLVHVYLIPFVISSVCRNKKVIVKSYIICVLFLFFNFTTFIAKYNGMHNYKYSNSTLQELVPFMS